MFERNLKVQRQKYAIDDSKNEPIKPIKSLIEII